jgi:predicted metal-dependent hydrolase
MRNLLEEGLLLFNKGQYYEAHEVWEDLWRLTAEVPAKTFYQGLIQAAVGLHHLNRHNLIGARSQIQKAIRNLESGVGGSSGVDLPDLLRQLEGILSQRREGPSPPVLIARLK